MNVWIEVTGGNWAWMDKLLQDPENKRGLKAPATSRYRHFLEIIEPGDVVLTYLTLQRTITKEWQSAIVGVSRVEGRMVQESKTLKIATANDIQLPSSIKFSDFKNIPDFSEGFRKAIGFSMQRYIVGITENDFRRLAAIHPENEVPLRSAGFLH